MSTMKALIGTLAVAFLTTTAVAGDEMDNKDKATAKFDKLDKDRDGKISKAEAKNDSMMSAEFASVDQDSDGYVSKSEFTAMAMQHPGTSTERQPSDYSREP